MARDIAFQFSDSGCWVCSSHGKCGVHPKWYGNSLSRKIWEDNFGPIPKGKVVRHKCDNPNCVNPMHLILGTQGDNNRDRDERGRTAKGEKVASAKLTEEQVREIKNNTELSQRQLARKYGVSQRAILLIKKGVNWAWV